MPTNQVSYKQALGRAKRIQPIMAVQETGSLTIRYYVLINRVTYEMIDRMFSTQEKAEEYAISKGWGINNSFMD